MTESDPERLTEDLTYFPAGSFGRLYTCDVCGEQYISPNALARHNDEHKEEPPG